MSKEHKVKYIQNLIDYLKKESTYGKGHPDPSISRFNSAFYNLLINNPNTEYFISEILNLRPYLEIDVLARLLSRGAQYILRKKRYKKYIYYSIEEWELIIQKLIHDLNYKDTIIQKNYSHTLPRFRYRAIGALLSIINEQVIIIDLGCSLNTGIKCLITGELDSASIIDQTPKQIIKKHLNSKYSSLITQGIGVDMLNSIRDLNWVKACEYFNNYEHESKIIDRDIQDLHELEKHNRIISLNGNITNKNIFTKIKKTIPTQIRKIINLSLVLYQLNPSQQKTLINDCKSIMNENDILIELNPNNRKDWFSLHNISNTIRIFSQEELSQPFEWLIWDSTSCNQVQAGGDFNTINKILS